MLLSLVPSPTVRAQSTSPLGSQKRKPSLDTPNPETDSQAISDIRGSVPFLPFDNPVMMLALKATYLADDEPVLGLDLPEGKRAYPLRMVSWHHIINDTIGKRLIAMTYCKACNAGVASDSVVRGEPLTFSLYGFYKRSFVMLDRETKGLWYQLDGRALQGQWKTAVLKMLPIERMSWGRWKALHPNTQVLASSTTEFANYPSLTPSNSKNRSPVTVSTLLIIALTVCTGLLTLLSIQRRREERRG